MNTLILVNPFNGLDESFKPDQLVQDPVSSIWISKNVLASYNKLNARLINEGIEPLILISGYRPYYYQEKLFQKKTTYYVNEGYTLEEAAQEAATIVARPGYSEHQSGLAIDVTTLSMHLLEDPLTTDFEKTATAQWLFENCHLEGFILRYPKEKTAITHITYEPWHYRYVGIEPATHMKYQNLSLEEYLEEKCKG